MGMHAYIYIYMTKDKKAEILSVLFPVKKKCWCSLKAHIVPVVNIIESSEQNPESRYPEGSIG